MEKRKYFIVLYKGNEETKVDITSMPPRSGENHHPGINEKIRGEVERYLHDHDVHLKEGEAFHLGKIFVDNDTGDVVEMDLRNPADREK